MSNSISATIVLATYRNKRGECKVYVRVSCASNRLMIPTNIFVDPEKWDSRKERLVGKTGKEITGLSDEGKKNYLLQKLSSRISETLFKLQLKKIPMSVETFKRYFSGVEKSCFTSYLLNEIEKLKSTTTHDRQTIVSYMNTYTRFSTMFPELAFEELDSSLVTKFDQELGRLSNKQNTRWKHHKVLKKFINQAIKEGLLDRSPYEHMKVRKVPGARTFLTQNEVQKLICLYDNKELLDNSLRSIVGMFLFCCFTGLRWSDAVKMTPGYIHDNFVIMPMTKNRNSIGKLINIPLTKTAKRFLQGLDGKYFFPQFSNCTYNNKIQQVCKVAGIRKEVTWHVSRHTFATLFLEIGGKVETLKELLGHSKIEDTMIYVHLSKRRAKEELSFFDEAFKKMSEPQ